MKRAILIAAITIPCLAHAATFSTTVDTEEQTVFRLYGWSGYADICWRQPGQKKNCMYNVSLRGPLWPYSLIIPVKSHVVITGDARSVRQGGKSLPQW